VRRSDRGVPSPIVEPQRRASASSPSAWIESRAAARAFRKRDVFFLRWGVTDATSCRPLATRGVAIVLSGDDPFTRAAQRRIVLSSSGMQEGANRGCCDEGC